MAQFTQKAIIETFMRLLEQKPLDKITVKDIIEECEISRGTFYYYYQDIPALVDEIFKIEAQKVIDDDIRFESWQDGFLRSTQFALTNRKIIYHIYNSVNREDLERYLYRVTEKFMLDFINIRSEGLQVPEEHKKFVATFYKCALVGLVLEWIGNGMKEDPEPYIAKLQQLFEDSIKNTLLHNSSSNPDRL